MLPVPLSEDDLNQCFRLDGIAVQHGGLVFPLLHRGLRRSPENDIAAEHLHVLHVPVLVGEGPQPDRSADAALTAQRRKYGHRFVDGLRLFDPAPRWYRFGRRRRCGRSGGWWRPRSFDRSWKSTPLNFRYI